jgi:hypothetical protein
MCEASFLLRWLAASLVLLGGVLLPQILLAQGTDDADQAASVCTFADGKELTVRYNRPTYDPKKEPPSGKVWAPGDSPMSVFTETSLRVGNADLPVGAYNMFLIPGRDTWTLVINRNVAAGSAYDEKQDIVRVPMSTGKLPQPEKTLSIYLGHIAPKRCEMRVDFGKVRADGMEFNEQ